VKKKEQDLALTSQSHSQKEALSFLFSQTENSILIQDQMTAKAIIILKQLVKELQR
jgi:hypothetical protein